VRLDPASGDGHRAGRKNRNEGYAIMRHVISAGLCLLAQASVAQTVRSCDTFEANARNLIFPVAENTASYAQGNIRLIALDTGGEPACCSAHLMVLLPAPEGPGQICALISADGGTGWLGTYLPGAVADYDPETGLTVSVPAREYGEVHPTPLSVVVTIDQQTGVVTAETGPP